MRDVAEWESEVRALLGAAPMLPAAARAAVARVLESLADDPSLDGATRQDVHRLRRALEAGEAVAEAA